ncbi:MAG: cupin domain-containing protein [Vicinamibacteria bacterium]
MSELTEIDLESSVSASLVPTAVGSNTRTQLMDLLGVPRGPIDRSAYSWSELSPGLQAHLFSEDVSRGVKRFLIWGKPGVSTKRHDHGGDEVILVLEGHLQDHRGVYGPGDICRSKPGDVHEEHVTGPADCVCFVVYYGDIIPV